MPLYEYACQKCGKKSERIEKLSGPHLKKCPHCGGPVERLLSAPAIQFKGSGWYVTDYAKSSGGATSDKSDKGEPSAADKSEAKTESKSDGGSSEAGSSSTKASKEKKKATTKER